MTLDSKPRQSFMYRPCRRLVWAVISLSVLLPAIVANVVAAGTTPAVRIGPFYPEAPNGITFIVDHQAAFLLRIGWFQNGHLEDGYHAFVADMKGYGPSAAGGGYNRLAWYVGNTRVQLRWSRTGPSIVGKLKASKPIRIALETTPSWPEFPARYSITRRGIQGAGMQDNKVVARWRVITASAPAAEIIASNYSVLAKHIESGTSSTVGTGTYGALVFNLKPDASVYFAAGTRGLENLKNAPSILAGARRRYDASRVAASGAWENFLKPINRDLSFARVYGPGTNITGYLAMRRWTLPNHQNVFEWDSFFAALQGSLTHPYRSRQTIHLVFAGQRADGMLENYCQNGSGTSNRSEPPIAAMCVWKLYQRDPDIGFLRRIYLQLVKWHNWWFATNPSTGLPFRDANKDGLLEYRNGPGSGMDDSPMYDNARIETKTQTMELDDVGLNSLWAADAGYLARIAQALGKSVAAAHFLHQKGVMIRRINRLLWNPKAGMYENRFFKPQAADEPISCRAYSLADGKPGIQGQYYHGTDFNDLAMTRVDKAVDFNWFSFPPGPAFGGQMSRSPMSVRWRGFLTPRKTGDYRLVLNLTYPFVIHDPPGYLPSVAGARLWVDGKLLINHWKVKPVRRYVSPATHLVAGQRYGIKLEYHRQSGGAMVQLRWQRVGQPKRIFSTQLSPTNFYPMIIGAPSKAMAAKMLTLLQNRHKFWGRYVIPSIPRDNPTFQQQSYWRGKIWPPTNYLLFQGLERYAPASLLNRFAAKSVKLFMRNWHAAHTWHENYFFTGQGSGVPHTTWGPLLCLIGLDDICDIRPDGKIALNGTLNEKIRIRNIPIGGTLYNVRVTPDYAELVHGGHVVMRAKGIIAVQSLPQSALLTRIPPMDRIKPVLPIHKGIINAPSRLRSQWLRDPLGIQQPHPRLTWMPPQRDTLRHEAAYQIQVAKSQSDLGSGHHRIWDSGTVVENPDFLPQYNGPAFQPYTHYYWRVRVWGSGGWKSQWSRPASWMTGPLKAGDWRGSWISYKHKISNAFYDAPHNAYYGLPLPKKIFHKSWIQKEPCPIFRKVFRVPANLRHGYMGCARFYRGVVKLRFGGIFGPTKRPRGCFGKELPWP